MWLPIESAPFDDEIILLWRQGDSKAHAGWWLGSEGEYEWAFVDETCGGGHESISPNAYFKTDGPTHWQPLPEPPQ